MRQWAHKAVGGRGNGWARQRAGGARQWVRDGKARRRGVPGRWLHHLLKVKDASVAGDDSLMVTENIALVVKRDHLRLLIEFTVSVGGRWDSEERRTRMGEALERSGPAASHALDMVSH